MRERAESGARWTSGATLLTATAQLTQLVVLAQLLSTAEFGLIGLTIVVLNLSTTFVDGGLSDVIIARKIADRATLVSLFWANISAAILVALIVVALAIPLANFYDAEGLRGPIYWVAVSVIAAGPGRQFMVLLQRELRFGTIAVANSTASIVGTLVAILAAVADQGASSFAIGFAAATLTRSVILVGVGARQWNPIGVPRPRLIKPHLVFAAYRIGERSVNYISADIDYLVIGKALGTEALGLYTLAYEITVAPLKRIAPVIATVAFPVFARFSKDDAYLQRGLLAITRVVAVMAWPGLVIVAATGSVMVPTIFGTGWEITVSLLPPLAIVGGLKLLGNPSGSIYLAKDRPDLGFTFNLATSIWLLVTFILAVQAESLTLIAWCYAISALGFLTISYLILRRLIGLAWGEYILTLKAPALITIATAAGTGGMLVVLPSGMGDTLILACAICVGVATALLTAMLFARSLAAEVKSLIAPRRGEDRHTQSSAADSASTTSA